MLEEINNLFRKIFSNEESLVFALLLGLAFFVLYFLGNILTPFLISIIFAYLLVGMQSRLEKYGLGKVCNLMDRTATIEQLLTLNHNDLASWNNNFKQVPRDNFYYSGEHKALISRLKEL